MRGLARLDSEMAGEIFRSALLVLAFWGVLSGLWPAIGGITGQYAGAAESTTVTKPTGVVTAPWDTEIAPSQSWIKVHVVSTTNNIPVQVLVVALNSRNIIVANASGFASADDFLAVANGKAEGTDVSIYSGHGGPVRYRISVHISDSQKASGGTDANVSYSLTWEIQKMDPMVIVGGLILFNMFFVTEYMLHLRRDIRAVSRRLDRGGVEYGRAPLAALGSPAATAADDVGGAKERGGFFRRREREPEPKAPPAPSLEAAPLYSPAAPAPPPRYAPSTPPESFGPPAYAPPPYAPAPYAPPAPPEPAPAPAYEPPPPPPAAARAAPRSAPPPPPPPAEAVAPPAPEGQEAVSKVRCPQCKHIVPVYTAERPTPIKCPNCGKRGMLTK